MATLQYILSQARRCCTTSTPPYSLFLVRSSRFCRSISSSSDPDPNANPEPIESARRPTQSIPVQAVSYPVKPKDPASFQDEFHQSPSRSSLPPRRPRVSEQVGPNSSNVDATVDTQTTLTREDIRYMRNVSPAISSVSYPSRVAPLPEDRPSASAEEAEGEVGAVKREGGEMEMERRRIEADSRILRRVVKVEEEKVAYPTLIKVEKNKPKAVLDLPEAIREVKANAKRNFDETIEAHVRLGIDRRRTDQQVSGTMTLPHGIGKVVKVAVFAEGAAADEARAAGADVVGGTELIDGILKGNIKLDFDKCITTPSFMPRLGKVAKILGKRGLMPNPKRGTIVTDLAAAVKEAKHGLVDFKMDKTAIVHVGLGKASFSEESLRENIGTFVNALLVAKPVGLKKTSKYAGYVNSFHLSSTMGPGYPVSIQSLSRAADQGLIMWTEMTSQVFKLLQRKGFRCSPSSNCSQLLVDLASRILLDTVGLA